MIRLRLCLLLTFLPALSLFATESEPTTNEKAHKGENQSPNGAGVYRNVPGVTPITPIGIPKPTQEEERLKELNVSLFNRHEDGDLLRLSLSGDLGAMKIDQSKGEQFANDDAKQKIVQFLRANAAVVGEVAEYEYIVDYALPRFIQYHQVVDGLEMPRSLITLGPKSEVLVFNLTVTKPGNPLLDKSKWMPESELQTRAVSIIESELGGLDTREPLSKPTYRLIEHRADENNFEDDSPPDVIPIYEIYYRDHVIQINALSGERIGVAPRTFSS